MTGDAAPGARRRTIAAAQVRPGEVDLFMFSAAAWLTHRIHFDRDYARSEGFRDLVVHGPLQGAYLARMLSGAAERAGGRLRGLSYRHHQPAYCAGQLRLSAELTSVAEGDDGFTVEVSVTIRNADEVLVTSGTASMHVPDEERLAALLNPDEASG
jgi:hydroxyacyl-ACP dehydratase HTD2-like protein with hotdog domain